MMEGTPFLEIPAGADTCFLMYFSLYLYHLVDLFLTGLDRPDFNEYFAHHICAVSLTLCSHLNNNRGLGLVIAYVHAITDIPVSFSRIFASTPYKLAV